MFDDHFEVFLADTEESKAIHYNIRYQVYCEEMGFENKDDFPLEQEIDEYDQHAAHFIVRHTQNPQSHEPDQWIGAMRLIFKDTQLLPIEKHCDLNAPLSQLLKGQSVELSRLCLVKEIRRRFSDIDPPHGLSDPQHQIHETDTVKLMRNNHRVNRSIIWGLIRAAAEYSYYNNIPNWLFLTTNALAKVLCKGGLELINIGEPCNHKGERFPYKMDAAQTYHSPIWNDDYKKGFQLFSKLPTKTNYSTVKAA